MKKILLMGNPNVGKSAIFSRLTGIHVVAANYPGTTVEFTQGKMKMGNETALLIDIPGTYGLEATSKAEEITAPFKSPLTVFRKPRVMYTHGSCP